MSAEQSFVHRAKAGGFYGVLVLFMIFPVMGITSCVNVSTTIKGALPLAIAAIAFLLWVTIGEEHRLVIGPTSVKLTLRKLLLGSNRGESTLWELPINELTTVTQINTRVPSSRGGWNYGSRLVFPGDRQLTDDKLGSNQNPKSEYVRLCAHLRERLGPRFVVEERV